MKRFFRELLGIYTCHGCGVVFLSDGAPVAVWLNAKLLGYECRKCFDEYKVKFKQEG